MKLRHLIAAVLLCSATNAFAMDAAGSFAVKGVGLSKCSAFVEIAKGKDPGGSGALRRLDWRLFDR